MKINRLLTVEQNGLRLAEKNYPSVIQTLWKEYVKDPSALERFVANRKGKGPAIEEIKDDSKDVNVIHLYYGDEAAETVHIFGGTHSAVGGTQMERFLHTPLFFWQRDSAQRCQITLRILSNWGSFCRSQPYPPSLVR